MRIIAKLDVKPPNVVKPVHFEGLRKIAPPVDLAKIYYQQGADELAYIDIVASLYRREILLAEIEKTANTLFIPFAVGGGVQSIDDFSRLFHHGADKVILNTYAVQNNPELIDQAAKIFGSQAVVINIEAKRQVGVNNQLTWNCYTDCGRMPSDKYVDTWVKEVQERGAGEILLQSVDMDGRQRGFDTPLVELVMNKVSIPVVVASGAGCIDDVVNLAQTYQPSGIALSSILHYGKTTIKEVKQRLSAAGVEVNL